MPPTDGDQQPQPNGLRARCLQNPQIGEMRQHLERGEFFWADLDTPDDETLQEVGQLLGLHALTVADAQVFRERAKFEEFPGYVFMVVYGVDPEVREEGAPLLREVHLIISGDWVVTIHKRRIDALSHVLRRYDDSPLRSEQQLVYQILDAIISTFFPVLERIDDEIDEIEDSVISDPNEDSLQQIFSLKRDLVAMRRVVTPLRDVFARNAERIADLPGMKGDDRLYFRDLYDSTIRVSDMVDSYRDLLSGATDLYLSTIANRQGEVNKQLTIIATVFLPLTFLTGFFGQNFAFLVNDVERSTISFIVLGLGLLVLSIIGFWLFFRHKRWI